MAPADQLPIGFWIERSLNQSLRYHDGVIGARGVCMYYTCACTVTCVSAHLSREATSRGMSVCICFALYMCMCGGTIGDSRRWILNAPPSTRGSTSCRPTLSNCHSHAPNQNARITSVGTARSPRDTRLIAGCAITTFVGTKCPVLQLSERTGNTQAGATLPGIQTDNPEY